jgi:hypothetical protein
MGPSGARCGTGESGYLPPESRYPPEYPLLVCLFGLVKNQADFQCPDPELNQGHEDFQSSALPTELSGHGPMWRLGRAGRGGPMAHLGGEASSGAK